MSTIKKSRKVKRRSGQVNLSRGRARISSKKPSKQAMLAAAKRLNRTKTRRYIVYAVGIFILMQIIRYIIYNFIYVGDKTPGGFAFLVIIYTQTGLMFIGLGFLVAASITYLRSLRD
jgi:hypothetical protein